MNFARGKKFPRLDFARGKLFPARISLGGSFSPPGFRPGNFSKLFSGKVFRANFSCEKVSVNFRYALSSFPSPLAAHSLLNNFRPPEKILARTESAEPCVPYAACLRFSPRPPLAMMVAEKFFCKWPNILALGGGGPKKFSKNFLDKIFF